MVAGGIPMGQRVLNLVGLEFGFLTVIEQAPTPDGVKRKHAYWLCSCASCGDHVVVRGNNLRLGQVKSCGCMKLKWPGMSYEYAEQEHWLENRQIARQESIDPNDWA